MPFSLRVSSIVAVAALVMSLAMAVPASADQAFHTQRIPLSAVGDAPLKSGAVIDIHTQGPTIYAQERYVLVGAEAGTTYQELRGVSMECDAELVRDPERVLDIGVALAVRYGAAPGPELRAGLARQAAKRVGIRFSPTRVASWDHRKLG